MTHRVEDARLIPVDDGDFCGFCGKWGTDKTPGRLKYEGQKSAGTLTVHAECEEAEEARASSAFWKRAREEDVVVRYESIESYEPWISARPRLTEVAG